MNFTIGSLFKLSINNFWMAMLESRASKLLTFLGTERVDGAKCRTSIVSHKLLNGNVGNASKRPKYCWTTCGRQLVRCASKRTGFVDHRLMDSNVRSTSTCHSILGHQVPDGNVSSTAIRSAIVSHQRLNGMLGMRLNVPNTVAQRNLSDVHLNYRHCWPSTYEWQCQKHIYLSQYC